ncbi:urease accessory protein UreF [Spirulina subsalsa]|uniref:urease accessory protein UreF n=1 Tax=Spirulina subsalsa TaxID=54311 RepID=UPI0002E6A9F3|nr:urease accessory protein UreF [Spirulina subsalsa]
MSQLLSLLQLVSSSLPVGAYSYSEGLESLVEQGIITDAGELDHWLRRELHYGAIQLEGGVMVRSHSCILTQDWQGLNHWNQWLSATRETQELRQQSWQMGASLLKLWANLQPEGRAMIEQIANPCHYAIAFTLAATLCHIPPESFLLGYLHSWATNMINGGVKLIPLGQTQGQQLLFHLSPLLNEITAQLLSSSEDDLETCSGGATLASMYHETQYTRLFRS